MDACYSCITIAHPYPSSFSRNGVENVWLHCSFLATLECVDAVTREYPTETVMPPLRSCCNETGLRRRTAQTREKPRSHGDVAPHTATCAWSVTGRNRPCQACGLAARGRKQTQASDGPGKSAYPPACFGACACDKVRDCCVRWHAATGGRSMASKPVSNGSSVRVRAVTDALRRQVREELPEVSD